MKKYLYHIGLLYILCSIPYSIYEIVKQEKTKENVILSYINKNKSQILEKTQSQYLVCNKTKCIANYYSLVSDNLLNTKREKKAFRKGQFYIFSIENNKIKYKMIWNEQELKEDKNLFLLSLFISPKMPKNK
ncbi:TPA: hypothetical protein NV714_005279 [Escherichia coli]|nr:hypothetical protein [Escherichia coli]